jgi:lysophospholipase L1-like esterase
MQGNVIDGISELACRVHAPRARSASILGQLTAKSASGRTPSINTSTTEGIVYYLRRIVLICRPHGRHALAAIIVENQGGATLVFLEGVFVRGIELVYTTVPMVTRPDVSRIADILVAHAQRVHLGETGIIVYYGSHAKGPASLTSDLDILYIPDEVKARSLCTQCILDGLPYFFWPVSWRMAHDIATASSHRLLGAPGSSGGRGLRSMLRWLGLLVGLLLVGCAVLPTSGGGGPPPGLVRLLALGDSYTIGQSVSPEGRWPVQLADLLRAEGYEVGEPLIVAQTGWTTGELSAGIDRQNPQGPFDLVSLLIGVNNQYRREDVEVYRAEFRALLARAIEFADGEAARVIVLSIPDWGVTPFAEGQDRARIGSEIDRFNKVNREETEQAGARYVDITPLSRQAARDPTLIARDGLHPSAKMYAGWAELTLPQAIAALGGR